MREILVFGAAGQVGLECLRLPAPEGWRVVGFTKAEVDVGDRGQVARAVEGRNAGAVINAAADTAVDKAESNPGSTFSANRDGAENCAWAARHLGVPLVHLSTDYVFDGSKETAYGEDDPTNPVSVYGASKAEGEVAVRRTWDRSAIVRTAWVFSAHGRNFVRTMLRLAAERDRLTIVDDQRGGPTAAADIARMSVSVALRLAEGGDGFGTYHYAGAPPTTWFGFASAIFEGAARRGLKVPSIEPIKTSQYPTPARRPMNSVLDSSKMKRMFGINAPDWRLSLDAVLDELVGPPECLKANGG